MSTDSLKLTPEAVAERLERLETEAKVWRWVCTSLLIAAAVVVLEGSALVRPKSRVEAQEIALRDSRGQVRAYFALNEQGKPELVFNDDQGRENWKLYTDTDNSASMAFFDQGHLRMLMTAPTDGSANLLMVDNDQRNMAHYYLHDGHHVGVSLSSIHDGLHLSLKDQKTTEICSTKLPTSSSDTAVRLETRPEVLEHTTTAARKSAASIIRPGSSDLSEDQPINPANKLDQARIAQDSPVAPSGPEEKAIVHATTRPISQPRLIPMPGLEEREPPRSLIDLFHPDSDTR